MTYAGVNIKHAMYTQTLQMKHSGMYQMPP